MALRLRPLFVAVILWGGCLAFLPSTWAVTDVPPSQGDRPNSKGVNDPGAAKADTPVAPAVGAEPSKAADEVVTIDVLQGIRSGELTATAEGSGDGRMTLNLTNRSPRKLRVVLPPGLIASGVSGQFGGMGGMGGGMGGMGMGGGMGGMGMGGMGMGGMGRGGGMGGMGRGGMGMGGRGMMGGGTLPASMGMMMLGRLIMTLVGDRDSWDQSSLMSGMMGMRGGMGGMGMGGMGMGGMGMGGMGGGFRSVPPTSLLHTTLEPKQTRHLPTALVSLGKPNQVAAVDFPEKGEKLIVGDAAEADLDPRTRLALARLAECKAPQTLCQLVMWKVSGELDWPTIEQLSGRWANDFELALARQFIERLEKHELATQGQESGRIRWDVQAKDSKAQELADHLRTRLRSSTLLGLRMVENVPDVPVGPAIAFRAVIDQTQVKVHAASTDRSGKRWVSLGSFTIKVDPASKEAREQRLDKQATELTDAMAARLLERLVHCTLKKGDRVNGKRTYRIRIENGSPLILNGLTLEGEDEAAGASPSTLAGFCLPPRKALTVPIAAETVERLGLDEGLQPAAADLSSL